MQGRIQGTGVLIAYGLAGLLLVASGCRQEKASEGSGASPADEKLPPSTAADLEMQRRIVGTWRTTMTEDDVTITGAVTYSPDGTAKFSGTLEFEGIVTPVNWSTTWSVRDNKIFEKFTESSMPDVLPVGEIAEDQIVRVTDQELVVLDADGLSTTYRREKE
jgi:hypothetical protein